MNRKKFLQSLLGASAFLTMPVSSFSKDNEDVLQLIKNTSKNTSGNMFGFKADPIKQVKVGIIGL